MIDFEAVFRRGTAPQLVASSRGYILLANPALEDLLGYDAGALAGMRLDDLGAPAHGDAPEGPAASGPHPLPVRAELTLRRQDGTTRRVELTTNVLTTASGAVQHATFVDVTDRHRARCLVEAQGELVRFAEVRALPALLQRAVGLLAELTDSEFGFCLAVDRDQRTLTARAWTTRAGGPAGHAPLATAPRDLGDEGAWATSVRQRRGVIDDDRWTWHPGAPAPGPVTPGRELVVPIVRRDAVVAIVGVGNKPVAYTESDLELASSLGDVAWALVERQQADEAAGEAHARERLVFEKQPIGQAVVREDGTLELLNGAFAALFGREPRELEGLRLQDLLVGDDRDAVRARFAAAFGAPTCPGPTAEHRAVLHARRRDGSLVDVAVDFAVLDEARRTLVATFTDVTAAQAAAAELRLLHTAVEQSPASVVITDTRGAIQYVNAKFRDVTGYTAEEARGSNPRVLKSGVTPARTYEELWKTIAAGEVWRGKLCNRRKDGSLYWENVSISPVRAIENGPITNFIAVKEDITAQRALELQLAQAQKLEAVGQLAAGIAHEINTPTQFASDSVRFLEEAIRDLLAIVDAHQRAQDSADGPARARALAELEDTVARADLDYLREHGPKAVEMSIEGLSRIAQIVRAMKDFSHPDRGLKTPTDVNAALGNTLTIARNEYKYVADVERDFGTLPVLPCFAGELNQVFLNLVVNAAHAIADVVGTSGARGTIRVQTRHEGAAVVVRVSDTGCGIEDEHRGHIFEPFFTTKAVGRGTGQGLAIAHNIVVKKHGGSLTFESEVGKGTTFTVVLPVPSAGGEGGPHP